MVRPASWVRPVVSYQGSNVHMFINNGKHVLGPLQRVVRHLIHSYLPTKLHVPRTILAKS
jgi:hypothetical protein